MNCRFELTCDDEPLFCCAVCWEREFGEDLKPGVDRLVRVRSRYRDPVFWLWMVAAVLALVVVDGVLSRIS